MKWAQWCSATKCIHITYCLTHWWLMDESIKTFCFLCDLHIICAMTIIHFQTVCAMFTSELNWTHTVRNSLLSLCCCALRLMPHQPLHSPAGHTATVSAQTDKSHGKIGYRSLLFSLAFYVENQTLQWFYDGFYGFTDRMKVLLSCHRPRKTGWIKWFSAIPWALRILDSDWLEGVN